MIPDSGYFQALRGCCQDDAAFERLQQLLAQPDFSQGQTTLPELEDAVPLANQDRSKSALDYQQLIARNAELEQQVAHYKAQSQAQCVELQELHRLKEVVLHTLAHDFRTFVMGTLMVLKNLLGQSGETLILSRARVERMVQGSDRQLGLINSLLETHHCDMQGIVLQREVVEFQTLATAIAQDLGPLLRQNRASLTNQIPADLPSVAVDPTQIQRVFEYLVLNLLRRNPPGLQLTLTATVEADMLCCILHDEGASEMGQVECDRLFDLQVRDPQARCSTELGIKLYLGRQIIAAHGGKIGAISNSQRGTTFWFTLPLANSLSSSHSVSVTSLPAASL